MDEDEVLDDTVEAIRDDLDNYGGRLRVMIEAADGGLFHVGEISTTNRNGEVLVTVAVGKRAEI
jgi:hypothetical protein